MYIFGGTRPQQNDNMILLSLKTYLSPILNHRGH